MNQHTSDLSDGFFQDLISMCQRLEANPMDVMMVMQAESGISASARNSTSSATGLIQIMSDSWQKSWGFTRDAFSNMTAQEQLKYVEMYLRPWKGRFANVSAVYTAVFMPALISHATEPTFVVCAPQGPFTWAYKANAGLDSNHKGYIVIDDLRRAVVRHCRGPRWDEAERRLREALGETVHVQSVSEVQTRLKELGFDVGSIDGIVGPMTMQAIKKFQAQNQLTVDGIVGPQTRKKLFP